MGTIIASTNHRITQLTAPPARPDLGVSAETADWTRERPRRWWDPSRRLLASIRGYQKWKQHGGLLGRVLCQIYALRHRFWSIVCAADIPLTCKIGGGLMLLHTIGIVIHPKTTIGPNCMILQGVTLGTGGKTPGSPRLGGHVDIGAGAKILGGVTIGDHAVIGANAVVLTDVPPGATAVGIPARILNRPRRNIDSN